MDPLRIAVLDDYQAVAAKVADWSQLAARAEIVFFHDALQDPASLVTRLESFDIVVLMRERTAFPEAVLSRLPRLKLITTTGQRNSAIDLTAAQARGVQVAGTRSAGTKLSTAILAWSLILALTRKITVETASIRSGGWQTDIADDIEGKTLGIVGLGRIGRQMANIAQVFGMRTIAWSQNLTPDAAEAAGVRHVDKQTLMATSDVISLHLVLSDRTRGIIDRSALAQMMPTAHLINTARGPLVDEAALVASLRSGEIAGAGLDVFDQEPLPADHLFRHLPNVIATPHIGYVTKDGYHRGYTDMIANILAYIEGRPVSSLLAPSVR